MKKTQITYNECNRYVAELDRRIGIRDGKLATVNNLREQLKAASGY